MKRIALLLLALLVSAPAYAQLRPGAFTTVTTTSTSSSSLLVGCAVGSSTCSGGIRAGSANVTGTTTTGILSVTSSAGVGAGGLSVTGHGFFGAGLDVTGNAFASGTLTASGNFAINTNKFTVDAATGNATSAGGFTGASVAVTNATVGSTLGVTGAVTMLSTLSVGTNATIGGTLDVTGTSTLGTVFEGSVTAGSLTMAGGASGPLAAGNTVISGTFQATGTSTLAAITATTAAFSSTATFNGGTTFNSGLSVVSGTVGFNKTINAISNSGDAMDIDIVGGTAIQFARSGTVSGSITMSGGVTTYNTTSDRRLKNDLGQTTHGLAEVMQMQVRDYEMKSDPGVRHTGFMAQQVEPFAPDAVKAPSPCDLHPGMVSPVTSADLTCGGWYQMDYGRITPLLTRAIQQQQDQIDTLKEQVASLAASVRMLTEPRLTLSKEKR